MVNRCVKCDRPAYYNYKKQVPIFCLVHRKPNMFMKKYMLCSIKQCLNPATHNYLNNNVAKFCIEHAKTNMYYVINTVVQDYSYELNEESERYREHLIDPNSSSEI